LQGEYALDKIFTGKINPCMSNQTGYHQCKNQLIELKYNLPKNERKAIIKDLRNNDININKADKGTTTVITSRHDEIKEEQVQLDNLDNSRPLEHPIVEKKAKKPKNHHFRTLLKKPY